MESTCDECEKVREALIQIGLIAGHPSDDLDADLLDILAIVQKMI